jgi:hypothetical protein
MLDRVSGSSALRLWRKDCCLSQTGAAPWFGRSLSWIKMVEQGNLVPSDLAWRLERVFVRYAVLEAFARAVQREVDPTATEPEAGIALRRAIEALRAAGAQPENLPQPSDNNAHLSKKVKPKD